MQIWFHYIHLQPILLIKTQFIHIQTIMYHFHQKQNHMKKPYINLLNLLLLIKLLGYFIVISPLSWFTYTTEKFPRSFSDLLRGRDLTITLIHSLLLII